VLYDVAGVKFPLSLGNVHDVSVLDTERIVCIGICSNTETY